jgi:hypothetical protein
MPTNLCLEVFQYVDEQTNERSLFCDISGGDLVLSSDKYKEKLTIPKLSLIGLLRLNTLIQSRRSLSHMTECPNINSMFCRIMLRVIWWMVEKLASFYIRTSNYPG